MEEKGVEVLDVGEQRVADELRKLSEDEERGFLEMRNGGGNGVEEEGEKVRPGVVRENAGSELGDGVAELLGDGFGVIALEASNENGFERGLGGGGEARPDIRRRRRRRQRVASEQLTKEDSRHGACFRVRRELKEMSEVES